MKKQMIFTLILTLTILGILFVVLQEDSNAQGGNTHWVSFDGQVTSWGNCQGTTPLNGAAACSLATANQNAMAGDTVYLRGGTYLGGWDMTIKPENSGESEDRRIVFSNYNDENVTIEGSYGIQIMKKSFITVNGLHFKNMRRFFLIYGSTRIVISNCIFEGRYHYPTDPDPNAGEFQGAYISYSYNDPPGNRINSTYNWVHHCIFSKWARGSADNHNGSLLDIGSNVYAGDNSTNNLIEDNVFAYGGHHTLGVYSKYNVIRNNYTHNETNDNWEFVGFRAVMTEGPNAGYNLYEGNRFGFAEFSGVTLRSSHNIFRFNTFYHNGSGVQVVSNHNDATDEIDLSDYNHIYHNTFYHEGYGALTTNPKDQGGIYFSKWSGVSPVGNVVKNNIFYDNKNGSVNYRESGIEPQIIENNWDQNNVNPGFVNLSGNDPQNRDLPDLHLQSNSPAIDKGTWLTTITSASGSGNSFVVADAGYFTDGWDIIEGDLIQLANGQRARINEVNYETNVITVSTNNLSWTQNMGLSIAYEGDAFDLGAYDTPGLKLYGISANQAIHLNWTANVTLPVTTTWDIDYYTTTTTTPFTVTIPFSSTRSATLTDHVQNYQWYTVTLYAMPGKWLSDTVQVMPTNRFVYLPLVLK